MAETHIGPGTLLAGRFTLEDLLEETDGAKFWRATDRTLARNVAVHVIPTSDPRANALLNAARASATVTDGHLLRVLDAAVEDDVVYVVNEWGTGISLDRMLTEGPLSPRRAAWVVKEVSEAISIAHRHGVAHGRLLPENVMVTEAGSVKLIGFVVDAVLQGRQQVLVSGGAPMSDHEADVVNLGALLYAALTGRWPGTRGSTVPDAPLEHGKPLRPRQVRAGVPRPLDAICDRVLNPDAHHHVMPIETAHEIFAALSDYIGDPTGSSQYGYQGGANSQSGTHAAVPEPTGVLDDGLGLDPADDLASGDRPADRPTDSPADSPADARAESRNVAAGAGAAAGAAAAAAAGAAADDEAPDPDATQAGAPVFYDDRAGQAAGQGADSGGEDEWGTPPPPPVLPEPEPKPLFAEGNYDRSWSNSSYDTRDTGSHNTNSTGPRNGSLPATWGPDADEPDAEEPDRRWETGGWNDDAPGKTWLRLAAVIAGIIVLVVGVVFAFNFGRGSNTPAATSPPTSSGSPSAKSSSGPVRVASVTDFDPEGDGTENPELAPLAIDGNPNTAWKTLTYYGRPNLGGLKSGVGLVVDLGTTKKVSSVQLTLQGSPTSVEILGQPDSTTKPTSVDGLSKLAANAGAGTSTDLNFKQPAKLRYFVVWLTNLPSVSGGYQGAVAEIQPRS